MRVAGTHGAGLVMDVAVPTLRLDGVFGVFFLRQVEDHRFGMVDADDGMKVLRHGRLP